jgi:hypothetical protein
MEAMTPKRPNNIGKVRNIKSINGEPLQYVVEDEIAIKQGSGKLIYLQKIKHTKPVTKVEYRFCYYMIGVKEGAKGRWVFGQYALMIPTPALKKLVSSAREKGWDIFD